MIETSEDRARCICGDLRPCAHVDKRMDGNWHQFEQWGSFIKYDAETGEYTQAPALISGGMDTENSCFIDFDSMSDEDTEALRRFMMNQEQPA